MDTEPEGERGTIKEDGSIDDRRHAPPWTWVLVGVMCVQFLLVSVAIAVGAIITSDIQTATDKATLAAQNANKATSRLDGAVRGSCARLQAERERANVAEATIFLVLAAAAKATPSPEAARAYREQAEATAWSPPANCARAVDEPAKYKPPPAIPFTRLRSGYAKEIVTAAKNQQAQPLP